MICLRAGSLCANWRMYISGYVATIAVRSAAFKSAKSLLKSSLHDCAAAKLTAMTMNKTSFLCDFTTNLLRTNVGGGEWGVGSGELQPVTPHSLLPTPRRLMISTPFLRQFDQHAAGGRRMDERDQRAARAGSRLLVNEPHAAGFQFG